jgi:SAM-dependent methyltransferase
MVTKSNGSPDGTEFDASGSSCFQEDSESFGRQVLQWLNGGMLTLMISVGHRTGLLDVMARLPPATSLEIARRAGLNERYVREWLASLVTGHVVTYDPMTETYALPTEHAAWLARQAAPHHLATLAQWLALLGSVEDRIVQCFRNGGGLPDALYARFQEVIAEQSSRTVVSELTTSVLTLVPGLSEKLEQGIRVLDIGCGMGKVVLALAEAFPRSEFVGCDISREAIARARQAARQHEFSHVRFSLQDAAGLGEEREFDLVTAFESLHEQAHPAKVLRRIARVLRPGGLLLVQDMDASSFLEQNTGHPLGPFLYAHSCLLGMAVSLGRGGVGLGTVWGVERAQEMLREAGFDEIRLARLPHDFQHVYLIAKSCS